MSSFLNSLKDKLAAMEQEMQTLLGEFDSIVARLDWGKLRSLAFRLNQDFNKLLDELFDPQKIRVLASPFVFIPTSPYIRLVTGEDLSRWRAAYKSEVRVLIGKGRVEVMAPSELAKEYKTTVSQVIRVAQQQGYIVLGWGQYQKLLDGIGSLIGGHDEQGKSMEASGHTVVGIPVSTTDSSQEIKMLPKSPASAVRTT